MKNLGLLDEAIRAVCPIHGVSVGRWEDRATWRVDFTPEATDTQKSAAMDAISRFDPNIADFAAGIQDHIDRAARSRGYADGFALAGYATDPEHSFEAQPFVVWRGQVWKHAYAELSKVQSGQREVPTIAELIGELPTITWP